MKPDFLIVPPHLMEACQRIFSLTATPPPPPPPLTEKAPERVEADFNPALTEPLLQAIEAALDDPWVTAVIAELRHMRALYCDDYAQFMVDDDDPEEWQRWVYRSGKPTWFTLPEWFLQQNEWMRPDGEAEP